MRADRTVGILDRHRAFQNGPEGLPDIKPLRLSADKDRYRLKVARQLVRRLGRGHACGLRHHCGLAGCRHRIELRLQFGFRGRQLRLKLGDPRERLRFGTFGLLPRVG